jgi:hypothetical protein
LKRDLAVPVGSANGIANNLAVEPAVANVISNLGGVVA